MRDLDLKVAKCVKMATRDVTDCMQKSGTGVDCDAIPVVVGDASLCERFEVNRDLCYFQTALRAAGVPLESLLL